MKQLYYVPGKVAYGSNYSATDATALAKNSLALFDLASGALLSAAPTGNFGILVGRGANNQPLLFPEVDFKSLTVTKAKGTANVAFSAVISIPSVLVGDVYTFVIAKKGVVFHERNTWSVTAIAKTATAGDLIDQLVNQVNANTNIHGIKATKSTTNINLSYVGTEFVDYAIVAGDSILQKNVTVTNAKNTAINEVYVKDLASRCAAGKGFNYTAEDAHEFYPGYPEDIEAGDYIVYTLRFAVPRVSAKQRDEVVYQLVHIAVKADAPAVTTLDTIFSITSPKVLSD